MNNRKTLALVLTFIGLVLTVGGPFVPGGVHLVPNHPVGADHVTDLIATPKDSILAGTQSGQVWQLRDRIWMPINLNLGGNPVMAMLGEPGRSPIGTSAGLYFAPPRAPELSGRVGSLLQTAQGLLAGTPDGVRWLHDDRWVSPGPKANIYTLFLQKRADGNWLHAGTVGAGVLSSPVGSPGETWRSNVEGLPEGANVFSFTSASNGALLAGTDKGLFWQPNPGDAWRLLQPELDGKRILALYFDERGVADSGGRLWIGGDDGLSWMNLAETPEGLSAASAPMLADSVENQPSVGVSWILPVGDRLMVSAGQVYEYGPTKLANWYWISLIGLALIVIAGWVMPRPQPES
ncbi:putative periplasmic ligand-binding sensor protein [Thiorhodococcus drewsii AZ1]|uniref:Putative periplasmic ligand-binding sensor protein n=1 Tax=Thiorhodococcus drewsii AZ1 TaxID=765913 RepID=G2DZP0_9GAMM|nr:hypothetical protein [Thiorhodococcus drewsii]EGV32267.1 putative periplasmic ligand-binding sensor protein [Thiorhodococcus drewsii AZ1]